MFFAFFCLPLHDGLITRLKRPPHSNVVPPRQPLFLEGCGMFPWLIKCCRTRSQRTQSGCHSRQILVPRSGLALQATYQRFSILNGLSDVFIHRFPSCSSCSPAVLSSVLEGCSPRSQHSSSSAHQLRALSPQPQPAKQVHSTTPSGTWRKWGCLTLARVWFFPPWQGEAGHLFKGGLLWDGLKRLQ